MVEGTGSKQYVVGFVSMASEFYTKTRGLFKLFVSTCSRTGDSGLRPRRLLLSPREGRETHQTTTHLPSPSSPKVSGGIRSLPSTDSNK